MTVDSLYWVVLFLILGDTISESSLLHCTDVNSDIGINI